MPDSEQRIREAIDELEQLGALGAWHHKESAATYAACIEHVAVLRRAIDELVEWREMYPEAVGIVGQKGE